MSDTQWCRRLCLGHILSFVLLVLAGCGGSDGPGRSPTATGMGQLLLHVTIPDHERTGLTPRALATAQTRQAETITLLRVVVSGPGIPTPIVAECPIPGPFTQQCQVTETPEAFIVAIALVVPVGTERLVVVTGFDQTGGAILRGTGTVDLTQPLQTLNVMLAPVQANTPPRADAGPDQAVTVGTTVTLLGNGSSDADGDPLTFAWVLLVRPPGSQATLSNPTSVNPTFVVDRPGVYMVQLTVNDGQADSQPDVVTLSTVSLPPVANAGPNQLLVTAGQLVQLDGSGSSDADGDPLTFQWALTTRPAGSQATLTNATQVNPTFVADVLGTYVAQLIVNDGTLTSLPATVIITSASLVSINVSPSNPQLIKGATLAFTATGLFTDTSMPDLTTQVTWQSSDAAIATISNAVGSQGQATGVAPGGPIVISAIAPPSLGGTITGSTQLSVLPFNNPPSFMLGPNQTVLENAGPQTITPWATAISPGPPDEANQTVNFIVSTSNTALFTVLPAISPDGTLTYTPAVHTNGVAVVTVRIQDNGGTANGGMDTSPPQTFTITVVDNRPPIFASILAMPTLAGAGVPITITFSVSEALQPNPTVIVAGSPATFLRLDGLTYTYTYTVQGTEPAGAAIITITGTDLAGNVGLGQSSITLDLTPPVATITFPGSAVLTYTQVTVRGTAQDANGITNVLVNGVAATSVDGFAHWEATLALAPGSHVLAVTAEDTAGNVNAMAASATIVIGAFLSSPQSIAVEASGQFVVTDGSLGAVVRVDPTTGNRSIVSDATTGTGPAFGSLGALAVEASGQLVVTDGSLGAVVRVDPTTGNRSIVSDAATGTGPAFGFLVDLAVEASGQLVVLDDSLDAVVRVDPTTGNRSIVSDATTGTGPAFGFFLGELTVEASGQLVVISAFPVTVVRVDPATGNRSIISDATTGTGPAFGFPGGLAVEASGQLVVTDGSLNAVLRVDPTTGNRSIVSDATTGTGPAFGFPADLAVEASGQLVVVDGSLEAVLRVDATLGNRTIVSPNPTTGSGPPFASPRAPAVEASGQLVVVDDFLNAVVRVDPTTGNRSIISDATTGTGPPFVSLGAPAVEASGQLVVTDDNAGAVVRVDPTTGNRSIVSDATTGTGPPFGFPGALAVEASGQLVVIDGSLGAIVRVDPTTGNRSIVSNATTGTGPPFGSLGDLAVEASGNLVVVDGSFTVLRIDPITGNRSIVSDAATRTGNGFSFISSQFDTGIAVEASGQLIVASGAFIARIDATIGDRAIISIGPGDPLPTRGD